MGSGLDLSDAFDGRRLSALALAARSRRIRVSSACCCPACSCATSWTPDDRRRIDGFRYAEDIGADGEGLLWGNAAFVFAVAVMRRFDQSGWFADLRGAPQDRDGRRPCARPAPYVFDTDCHDIAAQAAARSAASAACRSRASASSACCRSPRRPTPPRCCSTPTPRCTPRPPTTAPEATWNARISSMLQYMLCVSRFAHFLLMMMRDRVGSYAGASDVQRALNTWIAAYCLGSDGATDEMRARFPLRDAGIEVSEVAGPPRRAELRHTFAAAFPARQHRHQLPPGDRARGAEPVGTDRWQIRTRRRPPRSPPCWTRATSPAPSPR